MPSSEATRRASSTALSEQHPPCLADSSMSSRGHCCSVIPTTSCPCACSSAAATEESTPPDMAIAIFTTGSRLCVGPPAAHPLNTVEGCGLCLALEMDAHEVKALDGGAPVDLQWVAHLVK